MFANATAETCTGTGDTLELSGAISDHIAFSKSFSDGDLISYFVQDSGGTIQASGIGAYVSATDDITRNDTWNWNGTVIDDNPSSNITLSGGTHTIRCAQIASTSGNQLPSNYSATSNSFKTFDGITSGDAGGSTIADVISWMTVEISGLEVIENFGCGIRSAAASSNTRVAIYRDNNDGTFTLILDSGLIDTTSTGASLNSVSKTILTAGRYAFASLTDNASIGFALIDNSKLSMGGVLTSGNHYRRSAYYLSSTTTAGDPFPSTLTAGYFQCTVRTMILPIWG